MIFSIAKITKVFKISILLCLFLLQASVANDDTKTITKDSPYKITNTPIIKILEAYNSSSEYAMLHLDYFADECKHTLVNKAPFLSILMTNCLVASFFGIEDSTTMLYCSFKLLLVSLFFSGCNTLVEPKKLVQLASLFFYTFYEYIFPLYSVATISGSYIDKLGRNGYLPSAFLGLATLGSFVLLKNNDIPFIKNIYSLTKDNSLPVTPKMNLIKQIIEYKKKKDCLFLYSGSLKADNKDNLMDKLYKWISLHTDDISLTLLNSFISNKNTLEIPEMDEINKINKNLADLQQNKIEETSLNSNNTVIHPFYQMPLFVENCKLKIDLATKCKKNYNAVTIDNKTVILIHNDLNLGFTEQANLEQITSDLLINLVDTYKAIIVESLYLKPSINETIIDNEYKYFAILKNKGIYYLFFGLDLRSANNFIISRVANNIYKHLFWYLLSGKINFSSQSCLIVKLDDINELNEFLKNTINSLFYNTCKMNIYSIFPEKKLNKLISNIKTN